MSTQLAHQMLLLFITLLSLVAEGYVLRPTSLSPTATTKLENEDFFTDHLLTFEPLSSTRFMNKVQVVEGPGEDFTSSSSTTTPNVVDMLVDVDLLIPNNASTSKASPMNSLDVMERRKTGADQGDNVTQATVETSGKQISLEDYEDYPDDGSEEANDHDDDEEEFSPGYLARLRSNLSTAINTPKADRRFFFVSPFRRMMMAYLAPRILRMQMNMLVSTLVGEVGRKVFAPILGLDKLTGNLKQSVGLSSAASSSLLGKTSSSSPPLPKLSDLSELATLLSTLQSGAAGGSTISSAMAQLQMQPQQQQQQLTTSSTTPVTPIVSPRSSSKHIFLTMPTTATTSSTTTPSMTSTEDEEDLKTEDSELYAQHFSPPPSPKKRKTRKSKLKVIEHEQQLEDREMDEEEKLQELLNTFLLGLQSSPSLVNKFLAKVEASTLST